MAFFLFFNTMSGLPGRDFGWDLYLRPNFLNDFFTIISGRVFFLLTLDINQLLFWGDNVSIYYLRKDGLGYSILYLLPMQTEHL